MKKDITHHLLDSRKEDASLDIYMLESILIGVVFTFSALACIKPDLWIVALLAITLSIVFMGRLSWRNPLCKRDDVYEKATDCILLAIFLRLINQLQEITSLVPMTLQETLVLSILTCFLLFFLCCIFRRVLEALIYCICYILINIPYLELSKKMIQKELFWVGILFLICAIGLNSSYEKIFFFIGIIPISCISLLSCDSGSTILVLIKMCFFSVLLAISLPVYPCYAGTLIVLEYSSIGLLSLLLLNDYAHRSLYIE